MTFNYNKEEYISDDKRLNFIVNLKVGDSAFLKNGTQFKIIEILENHSQWFVEFNETISNGLVGIPQKRYQVVRAHEIFREHETDVAIEAAKRKEKEEEEKEKLKKEKEMHEAIQNLSDALNKKFNEANYLPHKIGDYLYYFGENGVQVTLIDKIVIAQNSWKFIGKEEEIYLEYKVDSYNIKQIKDNVFSCEYEAKRVYKDFVKNLTEKTN